MDCVTCECYSKQDACGKNVLDLEKSCESCYAFNIHVLYLDFQTVLFQLFHCYIHVLYLDFQTVLFQLFHCYIHVLYVDF